MPTKPTHDSEAFFSTLRYSDRGRCIFAIKRLDNGHEINFYARAANPGDHLLLHRSIDAFLLFAKHYDHLMASICDVLDTTCGEWLQGNPSKLLLRQGLDIVGIDANSLDDTRITFEDKSHTFGGHYVFVDFDEQWKIKQVGLTDL